MAQSGSFELNTIHDTWHQSNNTRSLTLEINHPGLIWTVIAFDAHVLSWSLDDHPLPHRARHHVKEASFYGVDKWSLDLVINGTTAGEKPMLEVSFQGIQEKGMWPGKMAEGGELDSMKLFAKMDEWLDRTYERAYDTLMLGIVGGVALL